MSLAYRDMTNKKSFNRTFMELKLLVILIIMSVTKSFNRTFMELKYCEVDKSR